MLRIWLPLLTALVLIGGCNDATAPKDVTPPAAPRGFYSVTGDGGVTLHWIANTESDFSGYRVYKGPCASGPGCPFTQTGTTTGTSFNVTGLANGVTLYFAISAVDRAGNESDLTYADVFDTPRPAGFGRVITSAVTTPATSGYDFSADAVRDKDNASTDMYFTSAGGTLLLVCPFPDTDIQDAGYAASLDAVDVAPAAGWSPTRTAEAIVGHCYVVRVVTGASANYAKFRVTTANTAQAVFDWAYQTNPDNPELHARPVGKEAARTRRTLARVN